MARGNRSMKIEGKSQKRARFRKVVLATTVLVSLSILMVGLVLAAWNERQDSISQSPSQVSAYADIAASGDEITQEYVAAVWSEGSAEPSPTHRGALRLRWGPPGENWKWPITPIDNDSQEPAVAVYSDTAYIAYTKRSGDDWSIRYAECPYGSSCTKRTIYGPQSDAMGSVDIAFCSGTRHVVWADTTTGSGDDIWYMSSGDGTTWSDSTRVSNDSTDDTGPSIACYGSTAYVAWVQDSGSVMYADSSNWGGTRTTVQSGITPYKTAIAAYGGYVDVVWDYKSGSQYYVREKRKSGGNWCANEIPDLTTYYASADSGTEYMRYLQPAIAVSNDTPPVPAVVWHADPENYEVMYSYGTGFGGNCDVTWSAPISLTSDFGIFKYDCSAPSVAIGISGTVKHTHVVFQQDVSGAGWEIYYTSDFDGPLTEDEPAHDTVYLPLLLKSY
jgi:hypothetical protein